jgi:4-hydroxybenzoate polyprenyltransferase
MYLNDVFDVGFDVRYRPERPIPAGKISRGLVGILGVGYLGTGTAILFILSGKFALLLPAAILLYNAVHKRTALSPFIMAVCRALIYPIAALSTGVLAGKLDNAGMWVAASTMAVWIILVSRVARNESVQQGSEKVSSNVVGQLLAAIPLVDMVSISPQPFVNYLPFAGCFLLAVLLGRSIPAS